MSIFSGSHDLELRVSPTLVLIQLMITGLILAVVGDRQPEPAFRLNVLLTALSFYTMAGFGWQLFQWRREYGAWFVILALVATIGVSSQWLALEAALAFAVVPTAVAAALLGPVATIIVATGETALLMLLPAVAATGYGQIITTFVLVSLWTVTGLAIAVNHAMVQNARWFWESLRQMRDALELARKRSATLEQTLEDLSHANRQLDLLNEKLAAARLLAEEAQKAKAEFVARVSHEFRTPLNMIIGLTDLLIETPDIYGDELSPDLLMDLKIVHRNCDHLSSMINDVLDLSQMEAGRLALHRDWVDLAEDIRNALLVVQPLLAKKRLDLTVAMPEDLPKVYCDRTRIRQVILNLLSNAVRYTQVGGIKVDVTVQDYAVIVRVQDSGPGISQYDIELIFEPFYRSADAAEDGSMGSGLGLSISKQFVDRHNGKIWVESEIGVGSTFAFKLPISPFAAPTPRASRWLQEDWMWLERTDRQPVAESPFRKRVVVYDETQKTYSFFQRGSDHVEVVNLDDLDQLAGDARAYPPHAVVLVNTNTAELWRQIEQLKQELPDTPIIGYCVPGVVERVAQFGVTGYLVKPITRAVLAEAIRGLNHAVNSVLIVDDNPDVQQLLTRMLYSLDSRLEVTSVSGGAEALDRMRDHPPDLLLLDIVLPAADGWSVLEQKNRDPHIRDIPVLIISAQDPNDQPVTSEMLVATIGWGVSGDRLLSCALQLSSILVRPDTEPDLVPE